VFSILIKVLKTILKTPLKHVFLYSTLVLYNVEILSIVWKFGLRETQMEVGERLKILRESNGLSQRKLASMSGVTNGLISMIEQGHTSPSVASLKRILDSIPMTFSEFFSLEYPDDKEAFFRASELREINPTRVFRTDGDKSSLVSLRQVGDASQHNLQMLHENYAPGADTGTEMYSHEAEEAGVIISGKIELTVGDQTRILGEGDAYIFDSRIPHRFRNTSDENCVIVSACTPPTF
jgi:transcriptional regulator with XRE-family HTH domain